MSGQENFEVADPEQTRTWSLHDRFLSAIAEEKALVFEVIFVCLSMVTEAVVESPDPAGIERMARAILDDMLAATAEYRVGELQ